MLVQTFRLRFVKILRTSYEHTEAQALCIKYELDAEKRKKKKSVFTNIKHFL